MNWREGSWKAKDRQTNHRGFDVAGLNPTRPPTLH